MMQLCYIIVVREKPTQVLTPILRIFHDIGTFSKYTPDDFHWFTVGNVALYLSSMHRLFIEQRIWLPLPLVKLVPDILL